ncbi:sperm-associated antigen 5-like [Limulus polyphemus]|uniref:Sperm-associated antigen 5-like n=1 Tax=Limulus polyphemus TaxID=6850 RepID=A0ABM1BUR0_LIMPO|nr:sperm-associated antigen 5-like [Limulus polyphemus]
MATDQQQIRPTTISNSPFSRSKSLRLPSRKNQTENSSNSLTRHGSIRLPKSASLSNTVATSNNQGATANNKRLKPLSVFRKPVPPPKPKLNSVSGNRSVYDGNMRNRASKMASTRAVSAEDIRKQVNKVLVKDVEENLMNTSTCSLPAGPSDSCSTSSASRDSPNSVQSEQINSSRQVLSPVAKDTKDLKPHLRRLTEEHEKLQMEYARLRVQHIELATAQTLGSPNLRKDFTGVSSPGNPSDLRTKQEICDQERRLREQLKQQENLITGYRDEVLRLQGEARHFQRKYWEQVMSSDASEVELEDASQQIIYLIERLESKQKELNQANVKIRQAEERLSSCNRELQQCRDAIDDYQSQLEGAEAQNALLQWQVKDLEGDVAEGRDSLEFLQVERSTLTETIQELENSLQLAREKMEQDKAHIGQFMDRCRRLYAKIQDKGLQNQVLQAQIDATEGRARDLLLSQGAELSTTALALTQLGYHAHSVLNMMVEYAGKDLGLNQEVLDEIISDAEETDSDDAVKRPEGTVNADVSNNLESKMNKLEKSSDLRGGDSVDNDSNIPSDPMQKLRSVSFVQAVIQAFEGTKSGSDDHSSTSSSKETSPKLDRKTYQTAAGVFSHQEEGNTKLLNGESDQIIEEPLLSEDSGVPDSKVPGSAFRPVGLATPFRPKSMKPQVANLYKLQEEENPEECSANKQLQSSSLESMVKKVSQLFQKMTNVTELIHEGYKSQLASMSEENKTLKEKVQLLEEQEDQLQKEVEAKDDILERTTAKLGEVSEQQKKEVESHQKELDRLQKQVEQLWEKNCCLEAVNVEQSRQIKEEIKKTVETAPQQMGMGYMLNALTICDKLALKQEIARLKKALETKEELLHNMAEKYARNKKVWEENCQKAEVEVQMLDDVIYQCVDTLQGIPEVVNSCESLRKLMAILNGGASSHDSSAISLNSSHREHNFFQNKLTV